MGLCSLIEKYAQGGFRFLVYATARLCSANARTASACSRLTPGNHNTKSFTLAPSSRFSKRAFTGTRVPLNSHTPLTSRERAQQSDIGSNPALLKHSCSYLEEQGPEPQSIFGSAYGFQTSKRFADTYRVRAMAEGRKATFAPDSAISFSTPNSVGHMTSIPTIFPLASRSIVERISSSRNTTVRETGYWLTRMYAAGASVSISTTGVVSICTVSPH